MSLAGIKLGCTCKIYLDIVATYSRVAIRPEVLFSQYISYFSDDVMNVEFESWSGSAKSVRAATRSNTSVQSDHSSMVQMVDRVWEW